MKDELDQKKRRSLFILPPSSLYPPVVDRFLAVQTEDRRIGLTGDFEKVAIVFADDTLQATDCAAFVEFGGMQRTVEIAEHGQLIFGGFGIPEQKAAAQDVVFTVEGDAANGRLSIGRSIFEDVDQKAA